MLYTQQFFAKKRELEEAGALRRAKAKAYAASLRKEHRRTFSRAVDRSKPKMPKVCRVPKIPNVDALLIATWTHIYHYLEVDDKL